MLTLWGESAAYCDRIRRRGFLKAGMLGLGSLGLADIMRLRADAEDRGRPARATSIIFVELAGGPTQFETYDPKPRAPVEIRGPLGTVATSIPGVAFSELMTHQAKIADKLAIIRSIHHNSNSHDPSSHLTQSGYYKRAAIKGGPNEMPCLGSVIAKVRGSNQPAVPAYVAIPRMMRNGGAAFLGKAHNPFETIGDPSRNNFKVRNLSLSPGLDMARLEDRRTLLNHFDTAHRIIDIEGSADAIDQFTLQAFDMVTGSRAQHAFDIQAEDGSTRDRYGRNSVGQGLLLARRLVEAGVTCVTVRVTGWDDHNKIADRLKKKGPMYDCGIAALVSDLYDRGMADDVLVVAMGEFGRTPRVNRNAGRDHWGAVMSVLLAGGGLRTGIVGASNSNGEVPTDSPYRPEDVLATLYRHLGIDPGMTFPDFAGRPRFVLESGRVISELGIV